MKVVGIGFHRTGTTTLKECLQHLGFAHHGYDLTLLREMEVGNLDPIRTAADQADSFEDWPWPLVFRKLDDWYQDAQFILTVRKDPHTWLKSVKNHAKLTGPTEARRIVYGHPRVTGRESEYLNRYTEHNTTVRKYFADRPGDLLEICWETGSGWDELCSFLGCEVPECPLPHTSRNTFAKWCSYAPKRWTRLAREALDLRLT